MNAEMLKHLLINVCNRLDDAVREDFQYSDEDKAYIAESLYPAFKKIFDRFNPNSKAVLDIVMALCAIEHAAGGTAEVLKKNIGIEGKISMGGIQ